MKSLFKVAQIEKWLNHLLGKKGHEVYASWFVLWGVCLTICEVSHKTHCLMKGVTYNIEIRVFFFKLIILIKMSFIDIPHTHAHLPFSFSRTMTPIHGDPALSSRPLPCHAIFLHKKLHFFHFTFLLVRTSKLLFLYFFI